MAAVDKVQWLAEAAEEVSENLIVLLFQVHILQVLWLLVFLYQLNHQCLSQLALEVHLGFLPTHPHQLLLLMVQEQIQFFLQ